MFFSSRIWEKYYCGIKLWISLFKTFLEKVNKSYCADVDE